MEEFVLKTKFVEKSQLAKLTEVLHQLQSYGQKGIANNLSLYIENRETYLRDHMGETVKITDAGILILHEECDNVGFGTVMTVGAEVGDATTQAMYVGSQRADNQLYTAEIEFQLDGVCASKTSNAIFDSGCNITTFNRDVLSWLEHECKKKGAVYNLSETSVFRVGGSETVSVGKMSIKLGSKVYENMPVYFAPIFPYVALIGNDIISSGKLDIDGDLKMVTFTRH